ncbi:hypothetical protein CDQ92_11460 [Sphingopyxis bauzanensis]|uniref:Uncharacterized protein n=1 Tax=Sphingopyxis bauzanensis TaxID=651663 RepID=A0A246JR02_9SPHN|nr:hypothetical protein [Sphingopyxis bauzanensis]OWQ95444.1 hypothetical protein CDQ92_11460 [Sphingopyxis bauzanensis]GGJ53028.1 hypothetical protein GCM10011393_24070 [Sphingopyxis bauzanensis]
MTIKPIITVSANEEPRRDIAPAGLALSVQLNIELRDPVPPEDDPRAPFQAFLAALPGLPFAAYARAEGATQITLLDPTWLGGIGLAPGGAAASVMDWLAQPTIKKKQGPLWHAERPADGELGGDPTLLSAGQRLSGSQTWPAPLPHEAGLTRLVEFVSAWPAAPAQLYIVPFLPDAPAAPPPALDVIALDGDVVQVLQTTAAWGEVTFEIAAADNLPAGLPLIDPASGFLKLDKDSLKLVALIRAIRQRSGSLFWLAPHLAGAPSGRDDERGQRIIWRAMNSLCTLLDPLFLTLAMPGTPRREGPLLGAILAEVPKHASAAAPPTAAQAQAFIDTVRQWVRGHSAIGDEAARGVFVDLLEGLLDHPGLTGLLKVSAADVAKWNAQYLSDQAEILPALLRLFITGADWPKDVDLDALEARVNQELAKLIGQMGSEDGFEAAILRAFRTFDVLADAAKALVDDSAERRDALLDALAAHFAEGYNALEAARQAQGSLFAHLLLVAHPAATSVDLGQHLRESRWFANRLRIDTNPGILAPLLDYVPCLTDGPMPDVASLATRLSEVYAEACIEIGADHGARRRFIPDTHPVDLAIRLPIGEEEEARRFGEAYDGVGLLVKRADQAQWAHVNLTRFKVGTALSPVAILPVQPAAVDGEYQLAHDYKGKAAAFAPATPAGEDDSYPPYFTASAFDDEDETADNDWPAGYALPCAYAYGQPLDAAAFAISRGGVLPAGVSQGDITKDGHLFPRADPDPGPYAVHYPVSRTTGIGRTVIERLKAKPDAVDAFAPPRGLIQPLTADYPRQALTASDGAPRWLDILRASDGTGTILLPERDGERVDVKLRDVRAQGGAITLALAQDPQVQGLPGQSIKLPSGMPAMGDTLDIAIRRDGKDYVLEAGGETEIFSCDPTTPSWLRVALTAAAEETASLVLADPQGAAAGKPGGGISASREAVEDLLILRPDANVWNKGFATETQVAILPPSMGPEDFDRWLANVDLKKSAAAGTDGKRVDAFIEELLATREALAAGPDEEPSYDALVKLFETYTGVLPDLAVDRLIVELSLVDALDEAAWVKPLIVEPLSIPSLGALLEAIKYRQGRLDESFAALAKARRIGIRIESSSAETAELVVSGSQLVARIPEGCVARLSIRPAVSGAHFEGTTPVIVEGLQQHAVGRLADGSWLFDGAALTVEVMDSHQAVTDADLVDLTNKGLAVEAAPRSRRYELTLDPEANQLWRHLSRAEIATQRWRPLGRPIYSWFNPHDSQQGIIKTGHDILRLRRSDPVIRFEAEAFEGDDTQSEGVRLDPLGARTSLHSGAWDAPSATIFRHRLTLFGRYAGALNDHKVNQGWPVVAALPRRDDWIRVAVLGDRSRIQVARPQLRLLMPLNRASEDGGTPPILAMLAEPPFAHGGLADRIGTGVSTSTGYAMKKPPSADGTVPSDTGEEPRQLSVYDLRAEIGGDPQLTYHALEQHLAQRVYLEADGPIGLTFDRDNGTASAFPNSAWALSPRLLGGPHDHDWQEHFLGVSMRRYLDPHWLAGDLPAVVPSASASFAFSETRWIEVRESAQLSCGGNVARFTRSPTDWLVEIFPQAILPEDAHEKPIPMNRFGRDVEGIGLLHQPLDKESAVLSVFALQAEGAMPRLLGSIQWRADATAKGTIDLVYTGSDAAPEGVFHSAPTTASLPTSCEWTRTGRDSAVVLGSVEKSAAAAGYLAERLTIEPRPKQEGGSRVTAVAPDKAELWLRPSQHDAANPIYLQRCLALLQTELMAGKGRALELFSGPTAATLLFGKDISLPAPTGEARVRVVELEMPARPVTSGDDVQIDLRAPAFNLGESGRSDAKTVLLLIRPSAENREAGGYSLPLTIAAKKASFSYTLDFPANKAPQQILVLQGESAGRAWYVDQLGALSKPLAGAAGAAPSTDAVSIVIGHTPTPWWGDVSVLTLPKDEADYAGPHAVPLDFDWLFGNADVQFETALTHAALRDLAGAQARIITVSPPIRRLREV